MPAEVPNDATGILLIAHAPLASALKTCALHVFPESDAAIAAYDVAPDVSPEEGLSRGMALAASLRSRQVLLLTDVFGATPANLAQRVMEELPRTLRNVTGVRLVSGVNLPMLLRALCYRVEPVEQLSLRAVAGGTQGVVQMAPRSPQNQRTRSGTSAAQSQRQQQQ